MRISIDLLLITQTLTWALQDNLILMPSVECFMQYKWCQLRNLTLNATQSRFSINVSSNFTSTGHIMLVNSSIPVLNSVVCDTFQDTRILYARNQSIQELEKNTLMACSILQFITLDHNRLKSLPDGLFTNNKRLEMIQLQSNQIKVLPVSLFHNLYRLQFLQLDRNDLSLLPVELFRDLSRLKYLTIFSNPLIDINAEKIAEYLPNIGVISLRDLDMQCDRMNDVLDTFIQRSLVISKFTDYGNVVRKRGYKPQNVKGIECLSDQQYEKVLETRDMKHSHDD